MSDGARLLLDFLLSVLLPPVGLVVDGFGIRRSTRENRRGDLALYVVFLLVAMWLTFVIAGLTFGTSHHVKLVYG